MHWSIGCIIPGSMVTDIVNRVETTNELRPSHEPASMNVDSSSTFPRRSITPNVLPTINTGLNARDAIERRPNVEAEYGAAVGERRSGVVVDDVSDFFACPWTMNDPIVSIEWRLGASKIRK